MCVMVVVNYPNLALDQYIGSSLLAMQIHPTEVWDILSRCTFEGLRQVNVSHRIKYNLKQS